jgi:sec-independent protein translocase protein TatC
MSGEPHIEASRAPLLQHLLEFRKRLTIAVAAWLLCSMLGYLIVEPAYGFLVEPLARAFPDPESRRLIYTSLAETFIAYVKLSCVIGLFASFPILAAQLYMFLAPGLYKKEKYALLPYLIAGPLLFFGGAALAYYFVMPMAWAFFATFETGMAETGLAIVLEAKVSEYLSLTLQVIFAFGIMFQLPILLTLLTRAGIVSPATLAKRRKYAVVIILTAAAFLTPPDVLSQILLFIPLYVLYEISIILCRRIERARLKKEESYARSESDTREPDAI